MQTMCSFASNLRSTSTVNRGSSLACHNPTYQTGHAASASTINTCTNLHTVTGNTKTYLRNVPPPSILFSPLLFQPQNEMVSSVPRCFSSLSTYFPNNFHRQLYGYVTVYLTVITVTRL